MFSIPSRACVLLILLVLAACAGSGSTVKLSASQSGSLQYSTSSLLVPANASAAIAIDAGGGSVGSWSADVDYSGGWTSSVSSPINIGHVSNAAPQTVYQTQRVGAKITYTLSNLVPNRLYKVRLHFAETWFRSAGQRVFNLSINGVEGFSNLDIFRVAGGKNIALIKESNVNADARGVISIELLATVNNAAVAGVQVISDTSLATPTPAPIQGSSYYPIYSSYFKANTPFHHTVKQLFAAGATVLSSTIANNYWAEGIANDAPVSVGAGSTPLFLATAGQPSYIFSCPAYGVCNANHMTIHLPSQAAAQVGSDHHLNSFDPVYLHGEIDGWGGDGNTEQACNVNSGNPGSATCSWGGFYPFSGTGLATDYSAANAGGYAFGLMDVAAGELLQGHIDHALGIEQSCLDDGGVYPAGVGRLSDAYCPSNLEPNATYGALIHLKSSVNVAALGYSKYCQVIVQALQTYGAYTADNNGGWGLSLGIEAPNTYSANNNPWLQTIFPSMVNGGDGSGSGTSMRVGTCLRRIPAYDIEVIRISAHLPAA